MARRIKIAADENSDRLKKHDDLEQTDSGIFMGPERSSALGDAEPSEAAVSKGSEISDMDNARLIKALQQYDNELLEQFFAESDDEPPVSISPEGRRKMKDALAPWLGAERAELLIEREEIASQKRIRAWKHKKRVQLAKRTVRWCATAAVILLMVMSENFIGNDAMAFRLPDVKYFLTAKNEYSKLRLDLSESEDYNGDDSPILESIETHYCLGTNVEGYQLLDISESSRLCMYMYQNSTGNSFVFIQQLSDLDIEINTEQNNVKKVESLYGDALLYDYNDLKGLAWNYHNYLFKIEGDLSEQQLIKFQEYLTKESTDNEK